VFVEVEVAVPQDTDGSRMERLAEAVEQLSFDQRSVIVLRYIEGLSIDETASALRCTPAAVKSRAHRGLASLRSLLDQETAGTRATSEAGGAVGPAGATFN
jgi:DNA-directed RNA polymerase specialized sigma24 family protein